MLLLYLTSQKNPETASAKRKKWQKYQLGFTQPLHAGLGEGFSLSSHRLFPDSLLTGFPAFPEAGAHPALGQAPGSLR